MSVRYAIAARGGRFAVVRILPGGDAAGYDPVADMEQQQRHFKIHRDWPGASAVDAAFADSRQYDSLEAAQAAAAEAGREAEPA